METENEAMTDFLEKHLTTAYIACILWQNRRRHHTNANFFITQASHKCKFFSTWASHKCKFFSTYASHKCQFLGITQNVNFSMLIDITEISIFYRVGSAQSIFHRVGITQMPIF